MIDPSGHVTQSSNIGNNPFSSACSSGDNWITDLGENVGEGFVGGFTGLAYTANSLKNDPLGTSWSIWKSSVYSGLHFTPIGPALYAKDIYDAGKSDGIKGIEKWYGGQLSGAAIFLVTDGLLKAGGSAFSKFSLATESSAAKFCEGSTQKISAQTIDPKVEVKAPVIAEGASNTKRFALGIDKYGLDDFAAKNGAETYKNYDKEMWRNTVLDKLADPNTEVLVNLDGVDSPWAAVQRVARGGGGATDWELFQIKTNPEWWDNIKWFENGGEVPNPFK